MGRKLAATIIHELGLDAVKDIHAVIPIPGKLNLHNHVC